MRHLILAVLAGMSISYPALAWHDVAHRYTAELAFASISAATQREVTAVLREHPRYQEDFAAYMPAEIAAGSEYEQGEWLLEQASIWPDLARDFPDDERSKYNRSTWHYINRMVWLESGDEEALRGKLDHNMATNFSPPLRQSLNSPTSNASPHPMQTPQAARLPPASGRHRTRSSAATATTTAARSLRRAVRRWPRRRRRWFDRAAWGDAWMSRPHRRA